MKLSLVTVVFDPDVGGFPPNPLAGIEGEIVSVIEHCFSHAGLPHLVLVVHHRPPSVREQHGRGRPTGAGGALALSDDERSLFDRLRTWRQNRAQADGVPVYVVMNNAQLAEIARSRPSSLSALRRIDGIGESKAGRYGQRAFIADLERFAIFHSYACRKEKGQIRALRLAQRFSRAAPWVLKGDITAYFASIPHDRLLALLDRRLEDPEILDRVARIVAGPAPGVPREHGTGLPIGSLTSQPLANLYLGTLDHYITDGLGFGRYLRYMDDFLVFGEREPLRHVREQIAMFLDRELGLTLNTRGTRLAPVRDGVPFLGFRVFPGVIRLASARWHVFRRRHRAVEGALADGLVSDAEAAQTVQSQFAHVASFDTYRARRHHLRALDERKGWSRTWREPCPPWRLVEERSPERAGRQPQQERPVQPERQRRFSRGELKPSVCGELSAARTGSVEAASRSGVLCPGLDQTPAPCLVPLRSEEGRGAESPTPGGGRQVAAGLFAGERR